jgi:hypothetical protein
MKRSTQNVSIALLLMLASLAGGAQNKQVLKNMSKTGQVKRYKQTGTLTALFNGQKITSQDTEVEKVTVLGVASNGDITMQEATESADIIINGEKQPKEKNDHITKWVEHPNGTVVSYHRSTGNPDDNKENNRVNAASNVIFSNKAVGVGDKWTIALHANPTLGIPESVANYEIISSEKTNGIDCFKITMAFRETTARIPIKSRSTFWIEKSSGDTVVCDQEIEGVRFAGDDGPVGSVKTHLSRIEGRAPKM